MTGIERLRGIGNDYAEHSWSEAGKSRGMLMLNIADQIEREQEALVRETEDVAGREGDALAWVREHGGLADVKRHWTLGVEASTACGVEVTDNASLTSCLHVLGCLTEYDVPLARAAVAELWPGGRPDECDNDRVIDELRRRLMPEGMEWPRFEDGKPVRFGDVFLDHQGNMRSVLTIKMWQEVGFEIGTGQGTYDWHSAGERVKRPAPKVLDADGVEIREGDTVWHVHDLDKFTVTNPNNGENLSVTCMGEDGNEYCCYPNGLTHRAPVLAADGRPLKVGQTVWRVDTGIEYWVKSGLTITADAVVIIRKTDCDCESEIVKASQLTHTKPEIDTWERLEEDAANLDEMPCDYSAKDLVRRCRALAERDRGE